MNAQNQTKHKKSIPPRDNLFALCGISCVIGSHVPMEERSVDQRMAAKLHCGMKTITVNLQESENQ